MELTHLIARENLRSRFGTGLGIGAAGFCEGVCVLPGAMAGYAGAGSSHGVLDLRVSKALDIIHNGFMQRSGTTQLVKVRVPPGPQ